MTNNNTQTTLYLKMYEGPFDGKIEYYLSDQERRWTAPGVSRYLRVKDVPCGGDMIPAKRTGLFPEDPSYWDDANAAQSAAQEAGYNVVSTLN